MAGAASLTIAKAGAADHDSERPFPVDLETATVAQLNDLLNAGTISSASLTEAYLQRIGALNTHAPALNAVRLPNPRARKDARAADEQRRRRGPHDPLLGIPVIVKDNIDV